MDDYLLRHLGKHLYKAGRYDDLIKQIEDPAWSRAQYAGLGSHAGYLGDLELGLQLAEGNGVRGLPLLIHYSFLEALVRASASEVSVDDIATQAQAGALQPALERADAIMEPAARARALAGVAQAALAAGQRALAAQIIERGLAVADEMPAGLAKYSAWIDFASKQVDLGNASGARDLLSRAAAGLAQEKRATAEMPDLSGATESTREVRRAPAAAPLKKGSQLDDPLLDPEYLQRQMAAARAHTDEQNMESVANAYASIVLSYARLGDIPEAGGALDSFAALLGQGKKPYTIIQPLAACTFKLIDLGHVELASAVVDVLTRRSTPPEAKGDAPGTGGSLVGIRPSRNLLNFRAGVLDSGSFSGPFGDSQIAEFAIDLAKARQPRLAMRVFSLINFGKYENFSDRTLAKVLDNIDDPALLKSLTGDYRLKQGQRAAHALVRQLARAGEIDAALELAHRKGPSALGEIAGVLLAKGDRRGREVLNEALSLAKKRKDSYPRHDDLGKIAAALARAGLPNEALSVWEQRGKSADPEADAEPGAEIARNLACAGRVPEALAFAGRLRSAEARCRALGEVGVELSKAGDKARARQIFEQARDAAPGLRSMDDREYALSALLDSLLDAEEFGMAFELAKSLDRLSAAATVAFEPGLIFKKAKDMLAQAAGLGADEDLAIDLSPDNQVKVIEAIAESGNYQLARRLAGTIKNVSVKEDLVEAVARSAAAAGDLDTAFEIAATLDEDDADYFLDDLQAQAANEGALGQNLASGVELFFGVHLAEMALRIQVAAAAPDAEAARVFDAYAEMACDLLVDKTDEESRSMGEWLLPRLLVLTLQTRSGRGLQQLMQQLQNARQKVRSDDVDTTFAWTVKEAAVELLEAGYIDGAGLYIPLLGPGWLATELAFEVACHQVYFGDYKASSKAVALPIGEFQDAKVKARFDDQLAGSVALGLACGEQFPQAREALGRVADTQLRADLSWAVDALQAALQGGRGAVRQDEMLVPPDRFKNISTMLLSFILRGLVAWGALGMARALLAHVAPPGKESRHSYVTSFGPQIEFGSIDRLNDAFRYLNAYDAGDGADFHSDRPAVALIREAAAAGMHANTPPPAWIINLIEADLTGSPRLAALAVLANWLARVPPKGAAGACEPVWQAFETARRNGLADVSLHAAGLSPLLFSLGGEPLVQDTLERLDRLKNQWSRR
jgi:hypothetical protein